MHNFEHKQLLINKLGTFGQSRYNISSSMQWFIGSVYICITLRRVGFSLGMSSLMICITLPREGSEPDVCLGFQVASYFRPLSMFTQMNEHQLLSAGILD